MDVVEFDICGATESDALYIPSEASLKITGTGTIKGGNTVDEQYNYVGGVKNEGTLYIWGPTLIGGDERETYSYATPGLKGLGTTVFAEGYIQAGAGNYSEYVYFTKDEYSVILECDDGTNYTVLDKEWGSNKRYLKTITIPQNLTAPRS